MPAAAIGAGTSERILAYVIRVEVAATAGRKRAYFGATAARTDVVTAAAAARTDVVTAAAAARTGIPATAARTGTDVGEKIFYRAAESVSAGVAAAAMTRITHNKPLL